MSKPLLATALLIFSMAIAAVAMVAPAGAVD